MNHTKSRAASLHVLNRVLGYMLRLYALPFLVVILCIVISAGATVMGATFPQTLVDDYIVPMMNSGSTDFSSLGAAIIRLACIMALGVVASFAYNRIMVTISQGTMRRLRNDLFQRMESLPIQYFDTHAHGDIMSVYTNDVDTLRQLLSQSIPQVINSLVSMAATLVTMLILNPVLKIRYDGININKIKKPDLRRSLGIVLQDTHLFTGTVLENIRYGNLETTDEECMAAAKLANADGFIRRLPDGYDTMLTGDGANLSQGQRQLIAIARAVVADPPVLILDEATSSIDTRTEKLVQDGMDALMYGRTTFVIAHRLSTVRNADCIMVMDQGRIIERGTHDELMEKKGTYYRLYTGNFEES